uniref:Glucan endo-1,3-beta-glucosidase, basic isoform n=1 Tax=Lygus hesperus TaxID=30085 RepID=A0A0A9WDC3_LYGHE
MQEFSHTRPIHILVGGIDPPVLETLLQNLHTIKSIHCINNSTDDIDVQQLQEFLHRSKFHIAQCILHNSDGTSTIVPSQNHLQQHQRSILLHIWDDTKIALETVLQLAGRSSPHHGVPSRPTPTYQDTINSINRLQE